MLSRRFLRRLPRPIRWLWFAILALVAAEIVGLALGLWLGGDWFWASIQLASLLAAPIAIGVVVVVGTAWLRPARPAAGQREAPSETPRPPAHLDGEPGRRAGQAVLALARSREGKAAIRQTARLIRAARAATREDEDR